MVGQMPGGMRMLCHLQQISDKNLSLVRDHEARESKRRL
jgi:hypothetical protein